jgi:hypothetical protein
MTVSSNERREVKRWRLRYSPSTWDHIRARAEAAAEQYRTGAQIRRWESPTMIALHGRAPWPAEQAAAEAYEDHIRAARANEQYPTYHLWLHYSRKRSRQTS